MASMSITSEERPHGVRKVGNSTADMAILKVKQWWMVDSKPMCRISVLHIGNVTEPAQKWGTAPGLSVSALVCPLTSYISPICTEIDGIQYKLGKC